MLFAWGIASLGDRRCQRLRGVPREEHVPCRRLRLRPAVRRDRSGPRRRQLHEQHDAVASRPRPRVRAIADDDGDRLRRRGGEPERLGGGGVLRVRRYRQRRCGRLQLPPRPARDARRHARPRADARDERDARAHRRRVRYRRRGPARDRATLDLGGRRDRIRRLGTRRLPVGAGDVLASPPSNSPTSIRAVAGRRDWTRETLAAGVRGGDRRALARAITLVENGDPLAYELVARPLSRDRPRVRGRASPARRASASRASISRARPARARGRDDASASSRSTRRARSRRARCSATGSGSPTTSSTRASSSARWGRAATSAGSRRRRSRRCSCSTPPARTRLPRDGRHGAERGRGDRHRRHRRARADAGLGRLGPGAEGRDHGDPRRDRDQQDGSPGGEDDAERGALDPRARPRPRVAAADRAHGGDARRERARALGRRSRSTARTSSRDGQLEERRRRNLAGEVFAVASSRARAPPRARGRATTPSCGGCSTRCSARELDPLTAVARDPREGVPRATSRRASLTSRRRARASTGVARVTPVYRSETLSQLVRARRSPEGREPPADGLVQDPRRVQHASRRSARRERAAGVVAASAGNHGQAVAWAAREVGSRRDLHAAGRADGSRSTRRAATAPRSCSAERRFEEALAAARALRRGDGRDVRPPVRGPARHRGPGDDRSRARRAGPPDLETVLIPIGGGGLASGIALALRETAARACGSSASRRRERSRAGRVHDRGRHRREEAGRADDGRSSTELSTTSSRSTDEEISAGDRAPARADEARRRGRRRGRRRRAAARASRRHAGLRSRVLSGGNIDATLLISVMRHGLALGRALPRRAHARARPAGRARRAADAARERACQRRRGRAPARDARTSRSGRPGSS